jgi:hypothetical protein
METGTQMRKHQLLAISRSYNPNADNCQKETKASPINKVLLLQSREPSATTPRNENPILARGGKWTVTVLRNTSMTKLFEMAKGKRYFGVCS